MTRAELALRRARDDEVSSKHDYEAARRRAGFDKECPRVARGLLRSVSVAYNLSGVNQHEGV